MECEVNMVRMNLVVCTLLLIILFVGCGLVDQNSDEARARRHIRASLNSSGPAMMAYAMQAVEHCVAMGWIGQNSKPDTVWSADSCYFADMSSDGGCGVSRNSNIDYNDPRMDKYSRKAKWTVMNSEDWSQYFKAGDTVPKADTQWIVLTDSGTWVKEVR